MSVTVADFDELKHLERPSLETKAGELGVTMYDDPDHFSTDDSLRLAILKARCERGPVPTSPTQSTEIPGEAVKALARRHYERSPGGSNFEKAFAEPEPRSHLLLWALETAREDLQAAAPSLLKQGAEEALAKVGESVRLAEEKGRREGRQQGAEEERERLREKYGLCFGCDMWGEREPHKIGSQAGPYDKGRKPCQSCVAFVNQEAS
jgi:hypothetical protein